MNTPSSSNTTFTLASAPLLAVPVHTCATLWGPRGQEGMGFGAVAFGLCRRAGPKAYGLLCIGKLEKLRYPASPVCFCLFAAQLEIVGLA